MKKPTKDAVLIESRRLLDDGGFIREDLWMTKEQLENFAVEKEAEERIERERDEASRLKGG